MNVLIDRVVISITLKNRSIGHLFVVANASGARWLWVLMIIYVVWCGMMK